MFFFYNEIRGCENREVQTVNWEGGKEGAVERGVKSSLKKAHKPWIRGAKKARTPWIREGRKRREVQKPCELGTSSLENSSVSVHSLHFMVCAPLIDGMHMTLKTVTSLNKESRLLKFHFP